MILCLISGSYEELCKDPDAVAWMLSEFKSVGKEQKLKGFEAIRALILEPEHFSIENGFLTPSFKYKRQQLQKHYQVSEIVCCALRILARSASYMLLCFVAEVA